MDEAQTQISRRGQAAGQSVGGGGPNIGRYVNLQAKASKYVGTVRHRILQKKSNLRIGP